MPEHFQQQVSIQSRPAPSVRAKPRVAPKPRMYPTATVMFEYTANDNDEISLAEGDMVEVGPKNIYFLHFITFVTIRF